ncbi:MAG: hypothetical protein AB7I04_18350 [Pseudomonadales bacterium]
MATVNAGFFVRQCRYCTAPKTTARGLDMERKRDLALNFANRHFECFKRANPDQNPDRCGMCGLLLIPGDRCPVHVYEERVEWTPELAAAFREIVGAVASGLSVTVKGGEFTRAYNFARLWGMKHRDVWMREGVA